MKSVTSFAEKNDKEFRQKRQKVKYIKISLWVGLTVLSLWSIGFFIQSYFCIQSEGVFTTLSTLFSALAFAGVIVTIIMQRDELELQRDEMELQRREMEGQREEFEKQNKTLNRQRFENTFFELLKRQVEIRNTIELRHSNTLINGLKSFKWIYELLEREVFERRKSILVNRNPNTIFNIDMSTPAFSDAVNNIPIEMVIIQQDFQRIFQSHENELLHYYNHLSAIIKFVNDTKADVEKARYIEFLKSELSQYEILCLFYFGLSDYGYGEFKGLLDTTNMFKSIDRKKLIDKEHSDLYKKNL